MKMKLMIVLVCVILLMGVSLVISNAEKTDIITNEKESETVYGSRPMKQKEFYLYSTDRAVDIGNKTTKQIYNTTSPFTGDGNAVKDSTFKVVAQWYLFPQLAGNLTLDGETNITMWARKTTGTPTDADIHYYLYEVTPEGDETQIAYNGGLDSTTFPDNDWKKIYGDMNIDNYSVSKESTIKIEYVLWGNANCNYSISWGNKTRDSRLTLPSRNYIKVEDVYTVDHEGNVTSTFSPEENNKNITIKATVTDPFGGYDIEWVNLTLTGPSGTIIDSVPLHPQNKTYGFFNTFESRYEVLWNYSNHPDGTYNVNVSAVDNTGLRSWYNTGDFGGHDVYGHHEFIIAGLDHFVNFRIVDDQDNILPKTTVLLRVEGDVRIFSQNETDGSGITNISLAAVNYTISIIWQDVEVSVNRSIDVSVTGNRTGDDPYNLTAGVFYPTIKVSDADGYVVEDANVYVTHPNGTTSITPLRTDQNGEIDLIQTAEGGYTLNVEWNGRAVGERDVFIDSSDIFDITVDIYNIELNVKDTEGDPVSNALVVFYYNDTMVAADSRLTNTNGIARSRLPGADYLLEITWNDVEVYGDVITVDSSGTMTVTAKIYKVTINVLDSEGDPLSDASVGVRYTETGRNMGSVTTNMEGKAFIKLAGGNHRFEVSWINTLVATEEEVISQTNTDVTITTDVYHLNIIAVDNTVDANPLVNASVSVMIDGEVVDVGMTDEQGEYVSKLPATDVNILIDWKGINVYDNGSITVQASEDFTAVCDVYYLDISVVDSQDNGVEDVSLSIIHDGELIESGISDPSGLLRVRLPVENFTIEGSWKDVSIGTVDHQMVGSQGDNSVTLYADIYDLEMTVVDDMGESVSEATVNLLLNGENVFTGKSDTQGVVYLRIPKETYQVNLYWKGFNVKNTDLTVDTDKNVTIDLDIYHVRLVAEDSQDSPISQAEIVVEYNGGTFSSGFTSSLGEYPVKIPHFDFTITIKWQGVTVHQSVKTMESSGDIPLACDVYYLTVSGEDSRENPVTGLSVSIYHSDLPAGMDMINEKEFSEQNTFRLPGGGLRLEAYWRGIKVADTNYDLSQDSNHTIACEIFYLQLTVTDSEGTVLDGANVIMKDKGGTTFATLSTEHGIAVPRLPKGDWTANIYWKGKRVGTEDISNLNTDKQTSVGTSVHYIRLTVKGKDGPVSGVEVTLYDSSGNVVATNTSNSKGKVSFAQIVEGDYSVEARLKKTQMMTDIEQDKSEDVSLDGSKEMTVNFEDYPRPIYTTNLFYVALLFVVVIAAGVVLIAKKKEVIL